MDSQVCPNCGIRFVQERIYLNAGNHGRRTQLYDKACRYAKTVGCINQNATLIGTIMQEDGFPDERNPAKRPYSMRCMR